MLEFVLLAARGGKGDPAVMAIGMIVLLIVFIVSIVRELNANYDVVTKGGAPYCPLCSRQVSYRRDYCRCCGYRFKTYKSPHPAVPREPKPFIDPALESFLRKQKTLAGGIVLSLDARIRSAVRSLGRFASCRWLGDLQDWFQPIAWTVLASGLVAAPTLAWASGWAPITTLLAAAWLLLAVAAITFVIGVAVQGRKANGAEAEDEALEGFVGEIIAALKSRPKHRFDIDEIAAASGVSPRVAHLAAEQVYAKFARTIVSDGVVTLHERRQIDQLAIMLSIEPDLASRIEEAARTGRYRDAVSQAMEDGEITVQEQQLLLDLRSSLGVFDEEVPDVSHVLDPSASVDRP